MAQSGSHLLLWLAIIQLLGLVSAAVARFSAGSRHQGKFQLLFFLFLSVAAGATIVSFGVASWFWLFSGVNFAVMVLTTTVDFRATRRPAVWG